MEIVKIPIEQLTPDPHNAKDHPAAQIEQIKASIQEFGNLDPIGVWGDDNLIVEGHGRYIALQQLGYTEADCIRLDQLTDEERRAYALVHNKTTMNSGFIDEKMDLNLDLIKNIDMSVFGFNLEIPNAEEKKKTTPDVDLTSRVYIGGVSLFGRDTDKILAFELEKDIAEHLLATIQQNGAATIQEKVVGFLGSL